MQVGNLLIQYRHLAGMLYIYGCVQDVSEQQSGKGQKQTAHRSKSVPQQSQLIQEYYIKSFLISQNKTVLRIRFILLRLRICILFVKNGSGSDLKQKKYRLFITFFLLNFDQVLGDFIFIKFFPAYSGFDHYEKREAQSDPVNKIRIRPFEQNPDPTL